MKSMENLLKNCKRMQIYQFTQNNLNFCQLLLHQINNLCIPTLHILQKYLKTIQLTNKTINNTTINRQLTFRYMNKIIQMSMPTPNFTVLNIQKYLLDFIYNREDYRISPNNKQIKRMCRNNSLPKPVFMILISQNKK